MSKLPKSKSAYLIFIDDKSIDDETLEDVVKKVGASQAEILYLIIQSYVGSPYSAVAIMNVLNERFDRILTVVPKYAKSAATLMALGTDEIYMGERSALGPLDLPIEHHKDGSRISALDVINTTTSMAGLVESIAKDRYKFYRDREVSKLEASKLALASATEFLNPIIAQVDPYHLQKAHRELRIGAWYAIDMLVSRMMKNDVSKAAKTAQKLVHDFPAHEYSIYSDDAEHMLGLVIKKIASLKVWGDNIVNTYEKVCGKSYHIQFGILEEHVDEPKKQPQEAVPGK
mgnify:CR=1 FL=1